MINFDEIGRMVNLMDEYGLEEFECEQEGVRVRLRKPVVGGGRINSPALVRENSAEETVGQNAQEDESDDGTVLVKSPIVGTFYRAPDPDTEPFVEVGSVVKKGQTMCIIEAMKLMNEIDAEFDGEVVTVFVENGQPIQYGDTLFAVKPS